MTKLNSSCNIEWSKILLSLYNYDFTSIHEGKNGSFILSGSYGGSFLFYKSDSEGENLTNRIYNFGFYKKRKFEYRKAVDGLRQILWGLFKKIVIADNCAQYANEIFNNSENYSGSTLVIGALFFTFQIYGDFSGYSDIAIGTSRLFGFNLNQYFAFSYFS